MWHQGKLKRINYNSLLLSPPVPSCVPTFLAFGYQQSSFKICQIMKVNDYQNCRITQYFRHTKSKYPMAIFGLLSFAFWAIANVVRRLYRLNTDIIPFILFHVSWISFFMYILLCSWLHLCLVFPLFSELLVKLAGERSLRPAPKRFLPLGPLANGIEINANESTIHNNNTAERTKYDETTIIMTRFTRKSKLRGGCNRIFKSLSLFSRRFEFGTSYPKIKLWSMRSNGILFL